MSNELDKSQSKNEQQKSSDAAGKNANKKKTPGDEKRRNIFAEQYAIYRAEFKKIVWPSRQDLIKQTITVIIISLLFGAYISLTDGVFAQALQQFVKFLG